MSIMSDSELRELGLQFHQKKATVCPQCEAALFAEVAPYMGKYSFDVYFSCRRCGAEGRFVSQDEPNDWTLAECIEMREAFYRGRVGLCPRDLAVIDATYDPSLGSQVVYCGCHYCGRLVHTDREGLFDGEDTHG